MILGGASEGRQVTGNLITSCTAGGTFLLTPLFTNQSSLVHWDMLVESVDCNLFNIPEIPLLDLLWHLTRECNLFHPCGSCKRVFTEFGVYVFGCVDAESWRICGWPTKGLGWQGYRASQQVSQLCWEAVLSCSSTVNSHCIPPTVWM